MYCEQCGQLQPRNATYCPDCGNATRPAASGLAARIAQWTIGAPAAWRSPLGWVRGLWHRNFWSSTAAFVAAWMGLPMAVLAGGLGGITGGIAGGFSGAMLEKPALDKLDLLYRYALPIPVDEPYPGQVVLLAVQDLVPELGWQVGGMLGAIIGAAAGAGLMAWDAFWFPWIQLWKSDPTWPFSVFFGNLAAACVLAGLYTAVKVAAERRFLPESRSPSRREREHLAPLLAEVCVNRLGLHPSRPGLLMADDEDDTTVPTVTAHARHIVVSTNLLTAEPDRALAILTHAVATWREGWPLARHWADGLACPLLLLYFAARRVLDAQRVKPVAFLLRLILWPVLVTVRFGLAPARRWWHRRRVHEADRIVFAAGLGDAWRDHLATTPARPRPANTSWTELTTVDPRRELRLDKLEAPGCVYPVAVPSKVATA